MSDNARPGHQAASFNISRWALQHPALTRYLMVLLLVLDVAAYFHLGQDEDPPFTFRAMVVLQVFWPGASALQMDKLVTDKVERTLQEMPYADTIRSYTKPGESLTLIELMDSAPPKEVANSWYQARKRVGDMRASLPQGVIGPVFNDDFGDVYGSIFALSADGFSDEEMRVFAESIRSQLLRLPDVAKVELFGAQAEKIFVEISPKRLAQLGLDLNQVLAQLAAQNAVEGAGLLDAGAQNLQVRVAGALQSVEQIRRFQIRASNPATGAASTLQLADIANVRRGFVDPPAVKVRHQGQPVIALGVAMAKGGDIIALGQALALRLAAIKATLPAGITLSRVQDQPAAVTRSVGEFVRVLIEAVVVLLLVSFIALGLHTKPLRIDVWPGMVVGITIPLVLAITFVPTASGRAIPLTQIARIGFGFEPVLLWRDGRKFAVTVQGDAADGVQGATVTQLVWAQLAALRERLPPDYAIQIAGAQEQNSKGQSSIAAGVPVMLFLIFTLLMLQLQSFSRAMPVFLTGPLGIAGLAGALLLFDRPFGFVALLGVIALMGMIMRNSVILIDQIEQDRRQGVAAWDAIVESAVRRFRPIVLTAAAAVLAMIPLTRSVFWGSMAVAIMGGLIVATALTLLALPAMYAAWFRVRRPEPTLAEAAAG